MSLCWYIYERLPLEGSETEFYKLYEEHSELIAKNWGMSDEEKAQVEQLVARLKKLSREAPLPAKWKRKGADAWMGADLCHCQIVLGRCMFLAVSNPYMNMSPQQALYYADDLRETMREWKTDHPGWSTETGTYAPRHEVETIQSAIRYLTRWANRGYCIEASY